VLVGHERTIAHPVLWAREVRLDPGRVALALERDEASNPVEVNVIGAQAVVFDADGIEVTAGDE
jgi:hypothetical protein